MRDVEAVRVGERGCPHHPEAQRVEHVGAEAAPTERDAADCVQLALDHGADINATNDDGQTALHVAASRRGADFIRYLVAHGARLDAKDKQGQTPLDVALGGGGGRGRGARAPAGRAEIATVLRQLMGETSERTPGN